jgi:hypothetical protein
MSGATFFLPSTPSWRGTQLKHRDNFNLPLPLPLRADGLWGPSSLTCNGQRGHSLRLSDWNMKLTTHQYLVPRLRMRRDILLVPKYIFSGA